MIKKINDKKPYKDDDKNNIDQNVRLIEKLTEAVNKLSFSLHEHKRLNQASKLCQNFSFLVAVILLLITVIWFQKG